MNYIITTAQRGAKPNYDFFNNLSFFSKENNAEILVLPTNGKYPSSTITDQEETIHPYIRENFRIVDGDMKLNNSLYIRNFPTKAQQMIPTTSWDRFVRSEQSAIMASPKIFVKPQANQKGKYPKVLMSTGACTLPNYKSHLAIGRKAMEDHVQGAIARNNEKHCDMRTILRRNR